MPSRPNGDRVSRSCGSWRPAASARPAAQLPGTSRFLLSRLRPANRRQASSASSSGHRLVTSGPFGYGGGGATTVRVYAAWVSASDQRAAEILGGGLPRPKSNAP
jgi:hypothetical protein